MVSSNAPHDAPVAISHQVFRDINALEVVVRDEERRDIRFTQLSLQPLHCDFVMVDFGNVRLIIASTNCPVRWLGAKIPDVIDFCGVLDPQQPTYSDLGYEVSYTTMSGLNPSIESDTVLPPKQVFFSLQISRDLVEETLTTLDLVDASYQYWRHNFVHAPHTLPSVQAYLRELLTLVQQCPGFLHQPYCRQLVLEDLVPLMIATLPTRPTGKQGLSPLRKAHIIKQAEAYIHDHLNQPLTVKALAEALYTSRRILFYAFEEVFGLSPMAYVKACRLQAVHRTLQAAEPETISIRAIAERHGFWSPGHFSRNYKTMFGQPPRQTLKQAKK